MIFRLGSWRLLLLGSLVGVNACDPCAGTAACNPGNHVSYTGHIVDHATGASAPATTIIFVRTGGVQLDRDTVSTAAGYDGFFKIAAEAKAAGEVVGDLAIYPLNRTPYAIPGLTMQTTRVGGDGGNFGRIVVDPYLLYVAQFRNAVTREIVGAYAPITFRRTGGLMIDPEVIETAADPAGAFVLAPKVSQPGVVTGEITVTIQAFGNKSYKIPIAVATEPFDAPPRLVRILEITP